MTQSSTSSPTESQVQSQSQSPSPSQSPPAPRALTPRQLDARRAAAQKSTGPRTARGKSFSRRNATQHGHYAGHYSDAFRETLLALKEDPDEYDRLRQRLLGSLATADDQHDAIRPVLALAIEELAQFHWELDRERRRQNHIRERRLRALDQELVRRRAEIKTDEYGPPSFCERGLVNGPRSANTYKAIIGYLAELIDQVDHQDFKNWEHHVGWVFNTGGEMPRDHATIVLDFKRLSGRYEGRLPDPDANTPRELRKLLAEEREKYQKEYEAFKPYWPVISEAERERARDLESLAEAEEDNRHWPEWPERLEWEASLQRQEHLRRAIDRKLRTVLGIQREARHPAQSACDPLTPGPSPSRERGEK